ncbi:HIT-type domain-containing protein [Caenorhabditis elegans]|uniref:HIT-type domain-containing protein n=1 Tax=Caenorhabditis elegans TaxID=6239 RepID=A9D699_CAEEL|nr:HIT-type domain-containing protein [Caenorhabditis elegans]CCD65124.1 HIT-type domain-containing protein [Caenorhabditis elegans]|eukprot:NP_001122894.1 Zinc finger, HIT-type [Caenorhabditis elegans]
MFAPSRKPAATANQLRASSRISNLEGNRTLDENARRNRRNRQLDGLEQDNSHDDPHANLVWNKNAPKFDDEMIGGPSAKKAKKVKEDKSGIVHGEKARRRKLARPEFNKQRFKKSFNAHVIEQSKAILDSAEPDYRRVNAYQLSSAPPSEKPARKFCAVCGIISKYCCTRCGAKYCSLPCRDVHNDTRCMKWLA